MNADSVFYNYFNELLKFLKIDDSVALLYYRISVTNLILLYLDFYPLSFSPKGRAERKEPARWAGLAKEPACRAAITANRPVR
jgi:hypothetical protein